MLGAHAISAAAMCGTERATREDDVLRGGAWKCKRCRADDDVSPRCHVCATRSRPCLATPANIRMHHCGENAEHLFLFRALLRRASPRDRPADQAPNASHRKTGTLYGDGGDRSWSVVYRALERQATRSRATAHPPPQKREGALARRSRHEVGRDRPEVGRTPAPKRGRRQTRYPESRRAPCVWAR